MVRSMELVDNELVIIYNRESDLARKTLAYGYALSKKVNKQDLDQSKISTTLFKIILEKLQLRPKDLLNKSDTFYQDNIRGRDFADEEWLSLLKKNPQLLKAPIAMYRGNVVLCQTPTDILKLS